MQPNQTTFDFYLASYLVATGIKLQSHNKINGRTVFNFMNNACTQEAIESYYSMSSSVEPISFSNSIKGLKTIVHSYDKADTNINTNSEGNKYVKQYRDNN